MQLFRVCNSLNEVSEMWSPLKGGEVSIVGPCSKPAGGEAEEYHKDVKSFGIFGICDVYF